MMNTSNTKDRTVFGTPTQSVINRYRKLSITFGILGIALLWAVFALSQSKNPLTIPFTANCKRLHFSNLFNYRFDCVYANYKYVPFGPQSRFIPKDEIQWGSSEAPVGRYFKGNITDGPNVDLRLKLPGNTDIGVAGVFHSDFSNNISAISTDGNFYSLNGNRWDQKETNLQGDIKNFEIVLDNPSSKKTLSKTYFSSTGSHRLSFFNKSDPVLIYPDPSKELLEISHLSGIQPAGVEFSAHEDIVAVVGSLENSSSMVLHIYSTEDGGLIDSQVINDVQIVDISISPDSEYIAILTNTHLRIFQISNENYKPDLLLKPSNPLSSSHPYSDVILTDNGEAILFSQNTDLEFFSFGLTTDNQAVIDTNGRIFRESDTPWTNVGLIPEKGFLIAVNNHLKIWNLATRGTLQSIEPDLDDRDPTIKGEIKSWTINSNLDRLWWGGTSAKVKSISLNDIQVNDFDIQNESKVQTIQLPEPIENLSITKSGNLLLIETDDRIYVQANSVITGLTSGAHHNELKSSLYTDSESRIEGLRKSKPLEPFTLLSNNRFASIDENHIVRLWAVETEFKDRAVPTSIQPKLFDSDSNVLFGSSVYWDYMNPDNPIGLSPFRTTNNNPGTNSQRTRKAEWNEDESLIDIHAISPDRSVAVGLKGGIYLSSADPLEVIEPLGKIGARYWSREIKPPEDLDPQNVFRSRQWSAIHGETTTNTVIAVGKNKMLALSTNAGASWTTANYISDRDSEDNENFHFKDVLLYKINDQLHADFLVELNQSHHLYTSKITSGDNAQSIVSNMQSIPRLAKGVPFGWIALGFLASVFWIFSFYSYRRYKKLVGSKALNSSFAQSDTKLGWQDHDILGIKVLARQISQFIRNENTEAPFVLGITGEWGSGKSSLMNLLITHLKNRGISTIWFNAWHHQSEEHLLASLFESIRRQAVPRFWTARGLWFRWHLISSRVKDQIKLLVPLLCCLIFVCILAAMYFEKHQIQHFFSAIFNRESWISTGSTIAAVVAVVLYWLRTLGTALPTSPAAILKKISTLTIVGNYDQKLNFRTRFGRDFNLLCKALKTSGPTSLVIFIDDLDRCDSASVFTVLEAVNYLTSAGDCIVVLGYQPDRVAGLIRPELEKSIDPTKLTGNSREDLAKHYLEKLINIEVPIPQLTAKGAKQLAKGIERTTFFQHPKDKLWHTVTKPRIEALATTSGRLLPYIVPAFIVFILFSLFETHLNTFRNAAVDAWDHSTIAKEPDKTNASMLLREFSALKQFWDNSSAQKDTDPLGESVLLKEFRALNNLVNGQIPTPEAVTSSTENENTPRGNISPDVEQGKFTSQRPIIKQELGIYKDFPTSERKLITPNSQILTPSSSKKENTIIGVLMTTALFLLWLLQYRLSSIRYYVETDPASFVDAISSANEQIRKIGNTPRTLKRFHNRCRFSSIRQKNLTHDVGFLDDCAKFFGYVSDDYFKPGEPQVSNETTRRTVLNDRQTVALCALEFVLAHFDIEMSRDHSAQYQLSQFEHNKIHNVTSIRDSDDVMAASIDDIIKVLRKMLKESKVYLAETQQFIDGNNAHFHSTQFDQDDHEAGTSSTEIHKPQPEVSFS